MIQRRTGADGSVQKRAVIFDFDGTIADSWPVIITVAEELMGRTEKFTQAEIDELRDRPFMDVLKALHIPLWKTPILLMKGRRMLKAHMHGIPVHEGMADVIKKLHADGVSLYVLSSNAAENVQNYLQWHKLSPYFTGVYGGASVFAKAPLLRKVLKWENIQIKTGWYVGDETRDVVAARTVGLRAAAVSWGYNTHPALVAKGPEVVADTSEELLNVLEQSWKK